MLSPLKMSKIPRLILRDVAQYVRGSKANALLLAILHKTRHIFNFEEERQNRLSRFVKVCNAYKAGMPISEIETKFGCTKRTIYDYLERANIPRRRFTTEEIKAAILKDYKNKDISIAHVAELHNVSVRQVMTLAKKAGLRRNRL